MRADGYRQVPPVMDQNRKLETILARVFSPFAVQNEPHQLLAQR